MIRVKTTQSISRTPTDNGRRTAKRDLGSRKTQFTAVWASKDCEARKRESTHRVYGAGAMEPMLKCGLFHQASSSIFPLPWPLDSMRTSEDCEADISASQCHPISGGSSVLRFLTVSMEAKDNMTHGRGSESTRSGRNHGWFEPRRRWQGTIFSLCNFVMYWMGCVFYFVDNYDDVRNGVR